MGHAAWGPATLDPYSLLCRGRRFGILLFVILRTANLKFLIVGTVLFGGVPASSAQTPSAKAAAASSATAQANLSPIVPRTGLNVVVIDPAHGGTDAGGRGTEGIRESEVVLQFADQLKKALEAQGFQVVLTREGNDNPSFDDRSARANAQRGAIFISLHVGSTGVTGTARVYVSPDFAPVTDTTGMIPWDRAQAPFVALSHKLGDQVQAELAKRFKGSPTAALVAPVRQLRTTAAPAIAVEVSSVSVADRADLERMVPGIADAVTRGVVAFKPSYVIPALPSATGGVQP
jgi:N-acetylmuramoyl-L-alanine amidase